MQILTKKQTSIVRTIHCISSFVSGSSSPHMPLCPMRLLCRRRWWLSLWALRRFCLHIVDTINANATFSLLEGIFKHQALFYNSQTQFMPRPAVVEKLVKLVTVTLGSSYHYPLKSGFRNSKSDLGTRISFKYSISRGVSSTPTVYVNGFELLDAGSPIDFEGWKTPLILWLTHEK